MPNLDFLFTLFRTWPNYGPAFDAMYRLCNIDPAYITRARLAFHLIRFENTNQPVSSAYYYLFTIEIILHK